MKFLVILNPSAQDFKAKKLWPGLRQTIQDRHDAFDLVETTLDEAENTRKIQAAIELNHYDRIVIIGGDGTIHLSINAILLSVADLNTAYVPSIAIIPFGTANDIAKSLCLPSDRGKLVEVALSNNTTSFDVGKITASLAGEAKQCFFIDSVSVGMDADILRARGKYRAIKGYLSYVPAIAERMLKQRSFGAQVGLKDQCFHYQKAYNIIINNAPIYAGEIEIPGSCCDDTLLDVCIFDRNSYANKLTGFAIRKTGLRVDGKELWRQSGSVGVSLLQPQRVQVDGEFLGEANMITCSHATQLQMTSPK